MYAFESMFASDERQTLAVWHGAQVYEVAGAASADLQHFRGGGGGLVRQHGHPQERATVPERGADDGVDIADAERHSQDQ